MTFFQMIYLLKMWVFHSYAARLPAISSQELFEDHKYHNCNGLNSFSPLLEGIPKLKSMKIIALKSIKWLILALEN